MIEMDSAAITALLNNYNLGSSTDPDATFDQYGNALYTALKKMLSETNSGQPPSVAEIRLVMKLSNDMQTYLKSLGGNLDANEQAMYNALNNGGQYSIASLSANFEKNDQGEQDAIADIQENPAIFQAVYNAAYNCPSVTGDAGRTTGGTYDIKGDLQDLQQDLEAYESNPTARNASRIAQDLTQLSSDLSAVSPAVSDGYLTILNSLLGVQVKQGDTTDTLLSLAKNESTDPTDFANALAQMKDNTNGGELISMVNLVLGNEY